MLSMQTVMGGIPVNPEAQETLCFKINTAREYLSNLLQVIKVLIKISGVPLIKLKL